MLKLAKDIVERLKDELPLTQVYVFGSRARGDYLDTSDIDLVFVLKGVKGMNVFDRMNLVGKYVWGNVDYIVLDEEEMERLPRDSKLLWTREMGYTEDL
ncbi:hypothetical protein L3N51_01791 [Metallosphaera sp. J1]|nr:hypothetical protein [Metallosphaera javensis (ex Hofmann et al. 2022)]